MTTNGQNENTPNLHPSGATLKMPTRNTNGTSQQPGDPMIPPPGITPPQFQSFISRATSIAGPEIVEVILPDNSLSGGSYENPCHGYDMDAILDHDYFVTSAVISPRSVPEVQEMMRLCTETGVPVWPYSIGRNMGYGGAAPRVPGSVGLYLGKNMNRVLKVDTEDAWALVEPGVTFFGLHEYLAEHGLREKVWLDVPDLGCGGGWMISRGEGSRKGNR
ncbi:hypothetical protein BKA64DRAFT_141336 [Cadophora sp. MPI-SDFR-AT-0126]|nr:hypothetical protein BKA64DRAFT_141336 [Leotiomycetes sp. MPI-SDFR-AT-0126]